MPTIHYHETFEDYQTGYHKGYEHGIFDASKLTWEDAKLMCEVEYEELVEKDNHGLSMEEVYKRIAERFNKERSVRLKSKKHADK